jgi:Na+/proline symporter
MMAAFAGPLILGAVWKGVTKAGAFAGLLSGGFVFIITYGGMINPEWFAPGALQNAAVWLQIEAPNPWSCAAMGELVSVTLTVVVSKLTQPLAEDHMLRLFPVQEG